MSGRQAIITGFDEKNLPVLRNEIQRIWDGIEKMSVPQPSQSVVATAPVPSNVILGGGIQTPTEIGEGHISILPFNYSSVIQGTWALVNESSQAFNYYLYNSSNAQNDQIDFKVYLAAGTYTFKELIHKTSDSAILTLLIDGISQGTIDHYDGSGAYNILASITGIVISTPGLKTLSLKAATRNVSATGWYLYLTALSLFRTL
jgi:hypothetical protein